VGRNAVSEANVKPNGQKAIATVRRFLTEMGLSPIEQLLPDRTAFVVAFDGPADQGIAQVEPNGERFAFHFVFSGVVPSEHRARIAEYIARANWRLIEGSFQLDYDSGELRYKVGIDFSNTELSEPLIRNAILSGMEAIEMFAMGFMPVIAGEVEPAEAYRANLLKQLQ